MEYNYAYDLKISNMKLIAKKLSSKIVMQHMQGIKKQDASFTIDSPYKIILLDKTKCAVCGKLPKKLQLNKEINIINNCIYLVDDSTYNHLGIKYIIIKDDKFIQNNDILIKTFKIFIPIYIVILLIGYFLAKLFLQPIVAQRTKLNNFIKDTTHELNTPISAIIMSVNSLQSTPKVIERIKISAKRVSEIYDDLTYLFLENQTDTVAAKPINLKPILEEQLEYFSLIASKKEIGLHTQLDDFQFTIFKEDFLRVVNNLISNAIKYTNKGGTIDIILSDHKLIVQDTGIGIPKAKQKDIFDRFYRANTITGGFGIGLNIVKNIIDKYDLKITLNSSENLGTTFTIIF